MTTVIIDGARTVDADTSGTAGTAAQAIARDVFGADAIEGATFSFKVDGQVVPPTNVAPQGDVVELVEVTEHTFADGGTVPVGLASASQSAARGRSANSDAEPDPGD